MKRITVTLPDELATLVDRERRRRDVSAATVIRDAIEARLAPPTDAPSKRYSFIGIGKSKRDDGFSAARIREFYERDIASIARNSGLSWPDEPPPATEDVSIEAEMSSPDLEHARDS
jgi:Arc/MetJ-type ribon-helix-helix transcriptional regulator